MPPTSKKLMGHIGFGLCVRTCVRPSVQKLCMLGFWNFIYGFLMEKYLTHVFFLVRVISLSGVMPFEKIRTKSDACHILWTVHTRVLKFHIWIPHGKVADPYFFFFSCPSYLPFWSYAPLKKSEWNLVSKISQKVFELGAWNMVSWGARWLSGRVSDSGARGPGFETYRRRVVSLSKTLYSPKVLVNCPGSDGSVPTWLKNCWLGR